MWQLQQPQLGVVAVLPTRWRHCYSVAPPRGKQWNHQAGSPLSCAGRCLELLLGVREGEGVLGECAGWLFLMFQWSGREMGIKMTCDGKGRRFEGRLKRREVCEMCFCGCI